MAILYEAIGVSLPKIKKREITRWIKNRAELYGKRVGDISYIFCSDDEIIRINREYLDHDYYTDIITFDYTEKNVISGDLFISLETVQSNAEKYKSGYEEELFRVIIHGVLHLCGLKDKQPKEKEMMRKAENEALEWLNINKLGLNKNDIQL